jgi:hypothetical protein
MSSARWTVGQGVGFGPFRACLRHLPVLPGPAHDRDRNLRLPAPGAFERQACRHGRDLTASGTGRRAAIEREAATAKARNVSHYRHLLSLFLLCARCRAARPAVDGSGAGALSRAMDRAPTRRPDAAASASAAPISAARLGPTIPARHVTGRVRAQEMRRRVARRQSHAASRGVRRRSPPRRAEHRPGRVEGCRRSARVDGGPARRSAISANCFLDAGGAIAVTSATWTRRAPRCPLTRWYPARPRRVCSGPQDP